MRTSRRPSFGDKMNKFWKEQNGGNVDGGKLWSDPHFVGFRRNYFQKHHVGDAVFYSDDFLKVHVRGEPLKHPKTYNTDPSFVTAIAIQHMEDKILYSAKDGDFIINGIRQSDRAWSEMFLTSNAILIVPNDNQFILYTVHGGKLTVDNCCKFNLNIDLILPKKESGKGTPSLLGNANGLDGQVIQASGIFRDCIPVQCADKPPKPVKIVMSTQIETLLSCTTDPIVRQSLIFDYAFLPTNIRDQVIQANVTSVNRQSQEMEKIGITQMTFRNIPVELSLEDDYKEEENIKNMISTLSFSQETSSSPIDIPKMRLLVHGSEIGDVVFHEGQYAGTENKKLEGFELSIHPPILGLGLEYMAHLERIGDTPFVENGTFIGTRGESRRLEGFAIQLIGPKASSYDVYYKAYLQGKGHTPLHSNGQFCGTRGESRQCNAMVVFILPK